MFRRRLTWLGVCAAVLAGGTTACETYREPFDLNFPQVLAVRLAEPQLMPGQRTLIDVLVTNDKGVPSVVKPKKVEFAPDPITGQPLMLPPEAMAFIEKDGDDTYAHAPDEATVDALATVLGLPANAALTVQLRLTVEIPTIDPAFPEGPVASRRADKIVTVLRPSSGVVPTPNPTIKDITVNGTPLSADPTAPAIELAAKKLDPATQLPTKAKAEHTFVVTADETAGPLTYAWFTGTGDVRHYHFTTAVMSLDPKDAKDPEKPKEGAGLMVVRNERGGVSWRQFALRYRL